MTNSNVNNQTSSDDIAIIEGEVINTNINEQTTSSSSTPLTVLGNPSNLIVPENPKDCFPFIAVCDGILRTAGNMLKQLNKEDEQYHAIMRISWQYAILRLKAQYNLGKYFSTIEGSQVSSQNRPQTLMSSGSESSSRSRSNSGSIRSAGS